jgi:hypothetical protein
MWYGIGSPLPLLSNLPGPSRPGYPVPSSPGTSNVIQLESSTGTGFIQLESSTGTGFIELQS